MRTARTLCLVACTLLGCRTDPAPVDAARDATSADVTSAEASVPDGATADTAPTDATPTDASATDVPSMDAAPGDGDTPDVPSMDAAAGDGGAPDAPSGDVVRADATPDGALADVIPADVALADAGALDVAPVDAGMAPAGRVEVLLGSSAVLLPRDGSPVGVEASCRFVPGVAGGASPDLRLRVSGPARLEGGRVIVQSRGVATVRCETAWPTLAAEGTVTAVGVALPGGWVRAGRSFAAIAGLYAELERADRADDRAAILAGATRLAAEAQRLQRLAAAGRPALWGWPGGWPSASALTAAGLAPGPDDAAALAAVADVRTALAALRTAWRSGAAGGSATLAALADGHARLDAAVRRFRALRPSAHAAIVNREDLALLLQDLTADNALAGATVAGALPAQLPAAPGALLLDVGLGLLFAGSLQGRLIDQMYGPAITWIEEAAATAATLAVLARSYVPTASGPAIASINRSNVVFVGRPLRVYGDRFSLEARHNMLVVVAGSQVVTAGGLLSDCLALRSVPRPTGPEFVFDFWDYVESAASCVDGLAEGTLGTPFASGTHGAGAVLSPDESLFAVTEWDAPPLTLAGPTTGLPLSVGFIPVNLEGGVQRSGSPIIGLYYR